MNAQNLGRKNKGGEAGEFFLTGVAVDEFRNFARV